MEKIIIFPVGEDTLATEIYCLPMIVARDTSRVAAVKLGLPGGSIDGRISYKHDFHPLHIEWLQRYAPSVSIVDNLPRDWEPLPEDTPTPTLDLELSTRPTNPGPLDEPDDKTEWERKSDPVDRDFERELRKRQWQSTLPDRVFSDSVRPIRPGRPEAVGFIASIKNKIVDLYNRYVKV